MPPFITGIDGTVYDTSQIIFDPNTQTFSFGQLDISLNMRRADQLLWTDAGFDVSKYNTTLSLRAHPGPLPGSTSTLSNFVTQITTDPFAAPAADLQSAAIALTQPLVDLFNKGKSAVDTTTSTIKWVAIGGAALVLLIIFRKDL